MVSRGEIGKNFARQIDEAETGRPKPFRVFKGDVYVHGDPNEDLPSAPNFDNPTVLRDQFTPRYTGLGAAIRVVDVALGTAIKAVAFLPSSDNSEVQEELGILKGMVKGRREGSTLFDRNGKIQP